MSNENIFVEELKDQGPKYNLNKFEYDLYHDESNVIFPIIRVKYCNSLNKGEKWKVLRDNKLIFTIDGNKVSIKCRNFLRTIDGVNFIIENFKKGIISCSGMKLALKAYLK